MKFSSKTVMIFITFAFIVFIAGVFIGSNRSASVPLADVSSLMPTELPLSEVKDEYAVINGKININTASADTLALLPGVSYTMAIKIVAYRESSGPFKHIDQLKSVDGFGEKRLKNIENYITVGD